MNLRKKLFALFFLSGFCGLLYQVVWMRLAFSHFGVVTPVLSVIVSVFMLGLSVGSWVSGRWIAPLTSRLKLSAAYAYALCEFLIGLGAFAVPTLYAYGDRMLLGNGELNSTSYLVNSGLAITMAILPWTLCMGATFPLMMAFIKEREPKSRTSFSFLYLANVIGAVLGTILTANIFVETFGFHQTLKIAGFTNFFIALWSLSLPGTSGKIGDSDVSQPALKSAVLSAEAKSLIMSILFMTGFVSMAAEVVWTRAFTPVLTTTVYAFALVLAIYLAATAFGSYWYRRHDREGKVWTNAELCTLLAFSSFLPLLLNDPRINLRTFGVELSLFPFCAILGYLTPKLIDQYSEGNPNNAGRAYAVNVIGCVIGPLVASYILLPYFGVKYSLIVLAVPFALLGLAYTKQLPAKWQQKALRTTAALFVVSFGFRSYEEKYRHGVVRRDYTATIISAGEGMNKHLFVNGLGITILTTITKAMAHLPLAFRSTPPESTLTICFGMGTTYRSLLTWGSKTTAVELVPSVKAAFGYYHADAQEVMQNPLGQIVIDDGRRYLRRTTDSFDLITLDPPPPVEAAASSLLYSTEFYELAKTRLKPGGILQQWFPGGYSPEAEAIARSLVQSFRYVRAYSSLEKVGFHFLCSDQPLVAPSVDQFLKRLPPAAKKDLMEWEKGDIRVVAQRILTPEVPVEKILGSPNRVVTDDRPFNEYYWLRRNFARARAISQ